SPATSVTPLIPTRRPTIPTWKESSRPPVMATGWSIPPGNQSTARSSSGPDTGGIWSRNPPSSAARSWNTSNPASPDMRDVFKSGIALVIPGAYGTPQAILEAGFPGLVELAGRQGVRVQKSTLIRILAWAQDAPSPDREAILHQRLLGDLNRDRITKEEYIQASERELVALLAQTPYVRLLALPGINVVLASELAGELGPIVHYATARVITGRAGLFPRRHQSGPVDYRRGLVCQGNRRLRQVLLLAAETLCRCNNHFQVLSQRWFSHGKDPRDVYVRVAGRLSRITFQMVAGSAAFRHPACQGP